MAFLIALITLVIGFFAGLMCFRIKSRWCGIHGERMTCAICRARRQAAL